jgi:hypothetical protein
MNELNERTKNFFGKIELYIPVSTMSDFEHLVGKKFSTKLNPVGYFTVRPYHGTNNYPTLEISTPKCNVFIVDMSSDTVVYNADSGACILHTKSEVHYLDNLRLLTFKDSYNGNAVIYHDPLDGGQFTLPKDESVISRMGDIVHIANSKTDTSYLLNIQNLAKTNMDHAYGQAEHNFIRRIECDDSHMEFVCSITGKKLGKYPASEKPKWYGSNFLIVGNCLYKLTREEITKINCFNCGTTNASSPMYVFTPCGHAKICNSCAEGIFENKGDRGNLYCPECGPDTIGKVNFIKIQQ